MLYTPRHVCYPLPAMAPLVLVLIDRLLATVVCLDNAISDAQLLVNETDGKENTRRNSDLYLAMPTFQVWRRESYKPSRAWALLVWLLRRALDCSKNKLCYVIASNGANTIVCRCTDCRRVMASETNVRSIYRETGQIRERHR